MADLTWPSDLGSATITGRVLYMEGDSSDPDREPDVKPAAGTITLEPSVRDLRYSGVDGSALMVKRLTKGVINAEGYVCTLGPDDTAGEQGLIVPATDSEVLSPTDFTYEVSIAVGSYRTSFSIKAPSGTTVDLASVAPVPPSGGTAIVVDPTTAERAETAATRAEAAAVEAEGYAPSFEWTGTELSIDGAAGVDLQGPPGPSVESIADVPGLQAVIDQITYDSGWLELVYDPAVAERVGTERAQVRRVGNVVELAMSVRTSATWTSGAVLAQLPAGISPPRVAYRPPGVYANASIPVVIGTDVRLYGPAKADTVYRISDIWTV